MCQILHHRPHATPVSLNVFYELAKSNPDGMGLAYWTPKRGQVTVFKTLSGVKDLYMRYYNAAKAGHEVLVHWRFTTHGDTTVSNCHPFPLPNGGVLFHNGMLSIEPTGRKSDTATLSLDCVRWGMDPFDSDTKRALSAQRLLTALSESSRLIALSAQGEIWRCGDWVDDIEAGYSWANSGCSIAPAKKYTPYKSTYSNSKYYGWSRYDDDDAQWFGETTDSRGENKPKLLTPIASGVAQPHQYDTGANLYFISEGKDVPEYPMVLCDDCLLMMTQRVGNDAGITLALLDEALGYGKPYESSGKEVVCEFCFTSQYADALYSEENND